MVKTSLELALESIVGIYNYGYAPNRIGVASLDYAYFFRCIILIIALYWIFNFMKSILNMLKWGVK
jgi:hypothetical protein